MFEKLVTQLIKRWLPSTLEPLTVPLAIRLEDRSILIDLPRRLTAEISLKLRTDEKIIKSSREHCRIEVPVRLPLRGGKRLILIGNRTADPDRTLIAALRKAHRMVQVKRGRPLLESAPQSRYEREVLRLAFLAPDLQRDILAGHHPSMLTLEALRYIEIPLCWAEQRRALGWPDPA
jgi:hypothetical protein